MNYPRIIQGGMGVAISAWPLARAVSMRGQLGVVSSAGIDAVLSRRLQLGDIGGHIQRAFSHFPVPEVAERVWERYFVPGGKAANAPFKSHPVQTMRQSKALLDMVVLANFVEVFLAKESHDGVVGINLLEKMQMPTLPSLFGAMMAGVDYVIMGAGIPRTIPAILDRFAAGQPAQLEITVIERGDKAPGGEPAILKFDPANYGVASLKRPTFLAIVSSALLALMLAKKCKVPPDGFVIEEPTAGGHNAPPRGEMQLNEIGEPVYGTKDVPDLAKFRELGMPFWLAGSWAKRLKEAMAEGAQGIQVGTAFAFCEESGMRADIKRQVLTRCPTNLPKVFTDPRASPTGFPFKVLEDSQTIADQAVYESRKRICDLGYLREAYRKPDNTIGLRCPAEPVEDFVSKCGAIDETAGRKCVCNGLLATAGFPQARGGVNELPLVTAGDDVANVARYLKPGRDSYSANDVIDAILGTQIEQPQVDDSCAGSVSGIR